MSATDSASPTAAFAAAEPDPDVSGANIPLAFALSIAASMSTLLGALLPFVVSIKNTRWLSVSLAFSAGVMVYVSMVELFPTGIKDQFERDAANLPFKPSVAGTLSFFAGVAFSCALDVLVHRLNRHRGASSSAEDLNDIQLPSPQSAVHAQQDLGTSTQCPSPSASSLVAPASAAEVVVDVSSTPTVDSAADKFPHHPSLLADENCCGERVPCSQKDGELATLKSTDFKAPTKDAKLKRMSMLAALAIGLHNFPEGLVTFVSAISSVQLGVSMCIAIAIHNIPEGVVVAIPVYYATGSRLKAFCWGAFSGLTEPIGAAIGYAGLLASSNDGGRSFSPSALGFMFDFVAGMMVFISFAELLPTAHKYDAHDRVITMGIFAGMLVMALSLVLFDVSA